MTVSASAAAGNTLMRPWFCAVPAAEQVVDALQALVSQLG